MYAYGYSYPHGYMPLALNLNSLHSQHAPRICVTRDKGVAMYETALNNAATSTLIMHVWLSVLLLSGQTRIPLTVVSINKNVHLYHAVCTSLHTRAHSYTTRMHIYKIILGIWY